MSAIIDIGPSNVSMYIAPNNTSYLEIGKNASTIVIGPLTQSLTTGFNNVITCINGVRIDSNSTVNNLIITSSTNKYSVNNNNSLNTRNTVISTTGFDPNMSSAGSCTAVGYNALASKTSGSSCTAVGSNALQSDTSGIRNTAIGTNALFNNTIGSNNVAIGYNTLIASTIVGANIAVGAFALNKETSSNNVAIGHNALFTSAGATSPSVAVGYEALKTFNNSLGGGNVAIGTEALTASTTGSNNVALGHKADKDATTGSDNIIIGYLASSNGKSRTIVIGKEASANADDQIIIGPANGAHRTWIQGSGGLNVSGPSTLGKTIISENIGTGTITGTIDSMSSTSGSLIIKHGNSGGGSSIVFPGKEVTDFGYIRYRDDVNNATGNAEQSRLEIGVENDFGAAGGGNDCLILNKNGGNVGIGTSNPAYTLDVSGNLYVRNSTVLGNTSIGISGKGTLNTGKTIISEDIGTGTITGTIDSMSSTSGSIIIQHSNGGGGSSIVFPSKNASADFGYIRYRDHVNNASGTAQQSRLEIGAESGVNDCLILNKNGGRVGIGTSNPQYKLDVDGTARIMGPMTIYEATGTGTITGTVDTMSATAGSLIIQHGNNGGGSSIVFPNRNKNSDYGYIRYRDDANNAGGENNRTRLEFGIETVSPGINTNDHLVLNKNGGRVGIGIIDPLYNLDISGDFRASGNGIFENGLVVKQGSTIYATTQEWNVAKGVSTAYTIQTGNTGVSLGVGATSWSSASDQTLKKNIVPMESMINKVMQLNPVRYNLIDTPGDRVGFIAQEFMIYFPEFVTEGESKLGIMYTELISVLTKCIQEQEVKIVSQQKENEDLKSRLSAIEARLAAAGI